MAKRPSPFAVLKKLLDREEELAEFIAGPDATGLRGWVQEGYRHRCRELSNVPGWARVLGGFAFGSASRICKPYWDENSWDSPTNEPQFTGGQCPTAYNVSISYTGDFGFCGNTSSFTETFALNVQGPLSVTTNNDGQTPAPGGLCPGYSYTNIRLFSNGILVDQRGSAFGVRLNSITPTRRDGQPDNCGDPPPVREPGPNPAPDPGPLPGPEPTDDPNFPEGPPLLPIPPYDDPLGGPTPIEAPEDDAPTVGPTDIPGNPDTSPGGGDDVSEPIAVDPGPAGGGNETDFGEPPVGRAWVGCLLRFTFPSSYGAIAGSAPANPALPTVVGNASLVFEGGRGDAFQVRSASMVLVRPTGALRVTGVYVNSQPGITYTIRPLSLKLCPDNECSLVE